VAKEQKKQVTTSIKYSSSAKKQLFSTSKCPTTHTNKSM
jgi:hypothetical protein